MVAAAARRTRRCPDAAHRGAGSAARGRHRDADHRARPARRADRRARTAAERPAAARRARRHQVVGTRCSGCPRRLGRLRDSATARLRSPARCGACASSVPTTARGCSTDSEAGVARNRPTGSREQGTERCRPPARGPPPRGRSAALPVRLWHPDGGRNDLAERARHEPVGGGGRPPPRTPDDRGRRSQRLPVPQPQELGLLAFLLLAERPPTQVQAGVAAVRRGRRPVACAALVPRRGATRARPGGGARRRPGPADAAAGASFDVDVLVHGHWNEARRSCPGSGRTCSTGWPSPTRSRSRRGCCRSAGASRRRRSRSSTRRPWGCWRAASSNGRATWPSGRR